MDDIKTDEESRVMSWTVKQLEHKIQKSAIEIEMEELREIHRIRCRLAQRERRKQC